MCVLQCHQDTAYTYNAFLVHIRRLFAQGPVCNNSESTINLTIDIRLTHAPKVFQFAITSYPIFVSCLVLSGGFEAKDRYRTSSRYQTRVFYGATERCMQRWPSALPVGTLRQRPSVSLLSGEKQETRTPECVGRHVYRRQGQLHYSAKEGIQETSHHPRTRSPSTLPAPSLPP